MNKTPCWPTRTTIRHWAHIFAAFARTDDLAQSLKQAQAVRRKQLWTWPERMAREVEELEALVAKSQSASMAMIS